MWNFRRELEDIINDRMVFWVAQMVEQNSDQLMTVWSNLDEDNPSRRRYIWRDLLQKEDILDIFEPSWIREASDWPDPGFRNMRTSLALLSRAQR